MKNTFWVEAQSVEIEHFQNEMEDLFCAKDLKKEKKKEEEQSSTTKKIAIVDRQQANNLAIILSRLKMSAAKIKEAIVLLDSSRLLPEDIAALAKFTLSKKDLSALLAVEDRSSFGVAERFFWEVCYDVRMTNCRRRKCLDFKFD